MLNTINITLNYDIAGKEKIDGKSIEEISQLVVKSNPVFDSLLEDGWTITIHGT